MAMAIVLRELHDQTLNVLPATPIAYGPLLSLLEKIVPPGGPFAVRRRAGRRGALSTAAGQVWPATQGIGSGAASEAPRSGAIPGTGVTVPVTRPEESKGWRHRTSPKRAPPTH